MKLTTDSNYRALTGKIMVYVVAHRGLTVVNVNNTQDQIAKQSKISLPVINLQQEFYSHYE